MITILSLVNIHHLSLSHTHIHALLLISKIIQVTYFLDVAVEILEVTIAKQEYITMSVWLTVFVFLLFHVVVYGTKVTILMG